MSAPPVIIAAVRHDAVAAETCHAVVRRAISSGVRGTAELLTVPVAGGYDGVSAWLAKRAAHAPSVATLIVHPEVRADEAVTLLDSGARGVVADQSPGWLIRHAAGVIAGGGRFLDPWLAHDVADLARPRDGNLAGVSGFEQRVLSRVTTGMTPDDIADELKAPRDDVVAALRAMQERFGQSTGEIISGAREGGLLRGGQHRATASVWETTRGLHGVSTFVVARDARARHMVAQALGQAGAHVVGCGEDANAVATAGDQWQVTVAVGAGVGLGAVRTAQPRAPLVVLTPLDADAVNAALGARAQGLLGANARLADVVAAVRSAAAGGLYLAPAALDVVLGRIDPGAGLLDGSLTPRQLQVLELADRGHSNRRIAELLGVAEATVKGHLRHTMRALRSRSRKDAATTARRLGLLDSR